ncbi:hypothetical protein THO17_35160 [Marinomonas sp. THO17]
MDGHDFTINQKQRARPITSNIRGLSGRHNAFLSRVSCQYVATQQYNVSFLVWKEKKGNRLNLYFLIQPIDLNMYFLF